MKVEAELLRITASAKLPDGQPYTWTIALPVPVLKKSKDAGIYLHTAISNMLDDFPRMVEAYLASKERN